MDDRTLRSVLTLQMTPKLGPVLIKNLIAYCGSAEAVVQEKPDNLAKIPGVGQTIGDNFKQLNSGLVDQELDFIAKHDIQPLYFLEKDYPDRLKDLDDAPALLFYKGNGNLNKNKSLGIVGTRSATNYGKEAVKQIVAGLSSMGIHIVSGLAHGIDETGHRAALENNLETTAILAHGLKNVFPAQNTNLAQNITQQGGLLTEFPSGFGPLKNNFPARNRIIAGLVDGLIVAESGIKGGALITADIAYSYNREVMAIPGKVSNSRSAGCNALIKNYKAYLVENAQDVAFHLGWEWETGEKQHQKPKKTVETSEEENLVLSALKGSDKLHINSLAHQIGFSVSQLSVILFNMELKGLVKALPGDSYELK